MVAENTKKRILIIDDDKIFCESFKALVEDFGYDVDYVNNGTAAIEKIKKEDFDLVFTDLIMPVINGVETCKEIKKIKPDLIVCLISGHPKEIDALQIDFMQAGGIDVLLRKPYLNYLEKGIKKALKGESGF